MDKMNSKKENGAELVGIGMGIALALAGFLFATYTFAAEQVSRYQDLNRWEEAIPAIGSKVISASTALPQGSTVPQGGIPVPYKSKNQKVELADQEVYALQGKVRLFRDKKRAAIYAFEVDLTVHPWLANYQRRISPYYALIGDASTFSGLVDQTVVLTARARGNVIYADGMAGYLISLDPITFDQP